ncbi:MAG TPA: hypothetical protein GXX37_12130 [Clostridiaceae bacterium]|nr:hypothetical protein [Clostridiaceae bacterium]
MDNVNAHDISSLDKGIENNKLLEPVFRPLSIKEIQPEGWLLNQLKIQAKGLSGNLDKFWPDIKDSKWIGGNAEGWERLPYWLDGFIPLAWLLNDEDMKSRAKYYINYIIDHQREDGWICPDDEFAKKDLWAFFLILKVLVLYHDATEDERIEGVIRKALLYLDRNIDRQTLYGWAHARWFECMIPMWWLYERIREEWILELAAKIHAQGFDWISLYKHWPYKKPIEKKRWSYMSHVVNNAMMLKSGPLLWRMTGSKEQLESAEHMVDLLDKYHGMVTGVFTGDECLAGKSPIQGTELCAVVEYMYSLEHLISITDRAHWGDRLEKIAYNALPATFSPDMWTHQYDQQVNQIECSRQDNPVFMTNGGESNIFGLEPNYGCCTANLSQGWPKFALSTFMKSNDGLVAAVYAPCSINTNIDDTKVSVRLITEYPFRDTLNFTVTTEKETEFSLWLRIPAWTDRAYLEIDGKQLDICAHEGYYCLRRKWSGETSFTLRFPMIINIEPRPNNLYAVTRGPLVYSLAIGEKWVRINEDIPGREPPHCDYEVYPVTPWNYGLCIDIDNPEKSIVFEEHEVGDCPFSPEGAPVVAYVYGKKIDWSKENGVALPYPEMKWISDEKEKLKLIPYGCTNLRMTEMPIFNEK